MNVLPLTQRVLIGGEGPSFHHGSTCRTPRCFDYKAWSDESMINAISAVTQEGMSVRRAAETYGVPRSTLGDRISGRIVHGTSSGASRFLNDDEEEELVSFILGCASIGYSKTIKEILVVVQRTLESRGAHKVVSYGWWESFRKRHPNLTLRVATSLSKARMLASNRMVLDHYFDLLEETLRENGLMDKPYQVFNMDETGMPLDAKPVKTIHAVGSHNPYCLSSGSKDQITVVGCVSAAGQHLPPMVIWDRKNLKPELTQGEYPQTIYGLSSKGWMDMELFEKWFSRLFLCCAPAARPLLLLLDGHSSHYSPAAIRMAAEEQVILFVLPPNTTHLSQPLDKGVFGPLKMQWRKACHSYMTRNPGKVVNRYVFSRLFHTAWLAAMTTKNITAGFRTTGIYPVDRNAIVLPGEKKKKKKLLSEETGVPYIPLFTPSKQQRIQDSFEGQCSDDEEVSSPSPAIHDCLSLQSELTKMLNIPRRPPPQNPLDEIEKYGARVLTSRENLELIERKERAKEEEKKAKQDAKKRRETARKEREKEKEKAKEDRARAREQREKSRQDAKERREIAKRSEKGKKAKENARQNKNAKKTQCKRSKGVLCMQRTFTFVCT